MEEEKELATPELLEKWFEFYFWVSPIERSDGINEVMYSPISQEGRQLIDSFYDNCPYEDKPFSCDNCLVDIYLPEEDKTEEQKGENFCLVFRKNTFRIAYKTKEDWFKVARDLLSVIGVVNYITPRDKRKETSLGIDREKVQSYIDENPKAFKNEVRDSINLG